MTGTCERVRSHLSQYYDGELPLEAARTISRHLQSCTSCQLQIEAFESISRLVEVAEQSTITPKANWDDFATSLAAADVRRRTPRPSHDLKRRWYHAMGRPNLALAASFLIAIGLVAWFAKPRSASETDLSPFIAAFMQDPDSAHQQLVSRFHGHPIGTGEAARELGITFAASNATTSRFRLASLNRLSMPCCDCLEALCQRPDGSRIAVFGHRCRSHVNVGNGPEYRVHCEGKVCRLVELPTSRYVVEWQVGDMKLLVVGARDRNEIKHLVDWLNPELPADERVAH